ncbi:protein TASOR isoform X2 [Phyllobates terribilis]|uniref:protein TASOR isoform X2 n=1 Tax=Phyllobates terribilis TaxID=111132 RepID=UPI003CCB11A2
MSNGDREKEDAETMEEEKQLSAANMDVDGGGGGNNRQAAAAEDTRLCDSQNGEAEEDEAAAMAAAERASCKRRNSSVTSEPASTEGVRGGSTPTEEPPRKRFQIPKKSREKKALQPINSGSRDFEEVLKILHSSYLDANSKMHFTYQSARMVHNEFLEKEFTEKRRQLKFESRSDKELVESYAFLLVDEDQVQTISEKGLQVGNSKLTTLGKSSMGVYLSKCADLLQVNPLEVGATGCILIFKVIKGKMKAVYDNFRNNQESFSGATILDPAPKHECHVLKNMNAVTTLLSYRAFERSQYYFYEYGFDEILKRPRHVCPYAVVSFLYKTGQKPTRRPSSPLPGEKKILHSCKFDGFEEEVVCRHRHVRPVNVSVDHYNDRSSFILWRGQLLSKGKLLCLASLKSTSGPFFPYKLPDKLDLDIVMRLEQIKRRIPPLLFFKETHSRCKEVLKGGIYSRLYEVSNKTKTGKELQSLLQKLEKEKLALVKPLADGGFLLFYFPTPMTGSYGAQSTKSYPLHALFIYPESKETLQPASHFKAPSSPTPDSQEIIPERPTFVSALHYAILKCQTDTSDNFNIVVEKHVRFYLKQRAEGSHKHKDYVIRPYDQRLDLKKNLFVAPYDRAQIHPSLNSYLHGSEAYTIPLERAKELIVETRRVQQFSPVSDYEPIEDDHDLSTNTQKVANERLSEHASYDQDRIKNLINLIQMKKSASNNTENSIASSGLKTKNNTENSPETEWKRTTENFLCNREDAVDSAHSVSTLISELGGQDTDLREENPEMETEPTQPENYNELLEKSLEAIGLLESISKLFPDQLQAAHEEIDKMEFSLPSDSNATHYEQSTYVQEQSVDLTPVTALPEDDGYGEKDEGPYSGYASPCPSTPTEELYSQQNSASSNMDSEMHWKLIPITGEEGRIPEDHIGNLRDEKQQGLSLIEDQSVYSSPQEDALPNDPRVNHAKRSKGSGYSPLEEYRKGRRHSSRSDKGPYRDRTKKGHFKSKHCHDGLIEQTVVEVYSKFSEQLQEVLRGKDILFNATSTPLLSSEDRVVKLSEWISTQASEISVQQYVEDLRLKLDIVVNSRARPTDGLYESNENMGALEHGQQGCSTAEYTPKMEFSRTLKPGLDHNGCTEEAPSNKAPDTPPPRSSAPCIDTAPSTSQDNVPKNLEINAFLISQINLDVYKNLAKIFSPENKKLNMVKFYIHAELEENTLCAEIKNYLTKLGNIHCHPDQYVHSSSAFDKLLIVIHNEDIEKNVHTIPSLTELKKRSCVSFAGVDSLDDLKNRTYNELFVSGGFIVPDDSVLNPDSVTAGELEKFLIFLEQINSPERKWQLKIHCKFQKKLKELGRTKPNALKMLALFNTYQKKHLVEILSYHYCDSQSRKAPELECLIKLQVQNIQQRHLIFLTEKNVSLFLHYADNGIVVTRMDEFMQNFTNLVGHHSSSSEGICLPNLVTEEKETALSTADVKEDDDMSLDSADVSLEIELCANSANPKSERSEAASLSEAEDTQAEGLNPRSPIVDTDYMQPVTPVSTAGSTTGDNSSVTGDDLSFRDYNSKQLGISPFNLLTHQTFLGSSVYPMLRNQASGENNFTNSYSQSTDQETAPHSEWDHKWNVK